MVKAPHRLFSVLLNAVTTPVQLAEPVERSDVSRLGRSREPRQRVRKVSVAIRNLPEAEHGSRFPASCGLTIPPSRSFNVTFYPDAVQVEPTHREHGIRMAAVRRLGIECERTPLVFGDSVSLQQAERFDVEVVHARRCQGS